MYCKYSRWCGIKSFGTKARSTHFNVRLISSFSGELKKVRWPKGLAYNETMTFTQDWAITKPECVSQPGWWFCTSDDQSLFCHGKHWRHGKFSCGGVLADSLFCWLSAVWKFASLTFKLHKSSKTRYFKTFHRKTITRNFIIIFRKHHLSGACAA